MSSSNSSTISNPFSSLPCGCVVHTLPIGNPDIQFCDSHLHLNEWARLQCLTSSQNPVKLRRRLIHKVLISPYDKAKKRKFSVYVPPPQDLTRYGIESNPGPPRKQLLLMPGSNASNALATLGSIVASRGISGLLPPPARKQRNERKIRSRPNPNKNNNNRISMTLNSLSSRAVSGVVTQGNVMRNHFSADNINVSFSSFNINCQTASSSGDSFIFRDEINSLSSGVQGVGTAGFPLQVRGYASSTTPPILQSMNPIITNLSLNFAKYRFKKFVISYCSTCPTTTPGSLALACIEDPSFFSLSVATNYSGTASCKGALITPVWQSASFDATSLLDSDNNGPLWKYCDYNVNSSSNIANEAETRQSAAGLILGGTFGAPGVTYLGTLIFSGVIEFKDLSNSQMY